MRSPYLVGLSSLVVTLLTPACTHQASTQVKQEAFQPTQTQPQPMQPQPMQPQQAQSTESQATGSQPTQFKPTQTQPVKSTPLKFKPVKFTPVQVQETPQEIRILLSADVLFDFDQANIRSDAADALHKAVIILNDHKRSPVRIEGYTDSKGSDAYNQTLSDRRAAAVKQWLVSQAAIDRSRLSTSGFGESSPVAPNTNPDGSDHPSGRQQNRRVELIVQK